MLAGSAIPRHSGGRLRGPTLGCFGHRISPLAEKFSQSLNRLVAVCREELNKNQLHTFE